MVEDNPADAEMVKISLEETGVPIKVHVARSGTDALAYLEGQPAALDLILLDLNLPRMNGFQILEAIRKLGHVDAVPVAILSGSQNPEEIERCYRAGANCYFAKAIALADIFATGDQIVEYVAHGMKPQ